MFLDFMTMWKRPGKLYAPTDAAPETPKRSVWQNLKSLVRFGKTCKTPVASQATSSTWHRRRIGILYSKQPTYWVFLVLIAPGSHKEDPAELKFCYRIILGSDETTPNAHCTGGLRFYNGAQASLEDTINYFTTRLSERGPRFLNDIILDVFWGWEEFLNHIRSQTMSVPTDHISWG